MIAGEALLDIFINANILFILGYTLWWAIRVVMNRVGLGHAYGVQLRLLNALFAAILLAPVIAFGVKMLQASGIGAQVNLNLSDMVVSYYLNGGIGMAASDFEGLILARDSFTLNILHGDGWLARSAILIVLAGLAMGLIRLTASVFSLWRIVTGAYEWRRIGRVSIRVSDRTLVPFSTRGLRRYYVVLPAQTLADADELQVALAHEFQHIRQGDLEWEVLMEALKPVFFLNPAYCAWKRQVEHLRELNCDSEVLSQGRINMASYCDSLLSVCQRTLRRDRAHLLAVPKVTLVTADRRSLFGRNGGFLKHRIQSILSARRPAHQSLTFVALVVPLVAAMALTSVAIQRPGDWSQDRLMLSTVVNLDRLDEINRMTTFGLPSQ